MEQLDTHSSVTRTPAAEKYAGLALLVSCWAVAVWFLAGSLESLLERDFRFGFISGLIWGGLVPAKAIQMTRERLSGRRSPALEAKPGLTILVVGWACAVLFLASSVARHLTQEIGFSYVADMLLGVVLLVCVIQMTRDRLTMSRRRP